MLTQLKVDCIFFMMVINPAFPRGSRYTGGTYKSHGKTLNYRSFARLMLVSLGLGFAFVPALALGAPPARAVPLPLPRVPAHAGFDDMGYAPALHRVIVPGGASGALFLVDPRTNRVSLAARVSPPAHGHRAHDSGTTSAAYADGYLIASDHASRSLAIVKVSSGNVITHVPLAAGSDYVRYLAPLHEVWVTEPGAHQIQVFNARLENGSPKLHRLAVIDVPGGPEALVFDTRTGRAYTNLWKRRTLAINYRSRKIVARWNDGCKGPRGLALAPGHHLLFVGCTEGKADALDLDRNGAIVARARVGAGVDIIAWNPKLRHLYVPGARSATMTVLKLTRRNALIPVAVVKTDEGSHCVTTDGGNAVYVCDSRHGRLLVYRDSH